jgi:energy-coupling factor transporter ATP-binding protein EcfA2
MIEARGLTKRFGQTVAADGLTFSVRPGEVTGFLGRDGAGKTTTLRMILGLQRPTSGTVTVDGRPYADLVAPLRHVGSLLDARAVQPGCTATEPGGLRGLLAYVAIELSAGISPAAGQIAPLAFCRSGSLPECARNRRFCGGIRSCPAAAHLQCGRIARSGRGGRGRTGDLGPCRPGPMPAEPSRGSVNVRIAQGKGSPEGNRRRTGTGQRPKGTNRRTPDEGKPEEGGRRGKNPAGKRETGGKPAGETGGREVRPQTTR